MSTDESESCRLTEIQKVDFGLTVVLQNSRVEVHAEGGCCSCEHQRGAKAGSSPTVDIKPWHKVAYLWRLLKQ